MLSPKHQTGGFTLLAGWIHAPCGPLLQVLTLKHQTEMRFATYRRREAATEQQRRREGGLEGPFTLHVVIRLTFFLLASLLLLLSGFLLLQVRIAT